MTNNTNPKSRYQRALDALGFDEPFLTTKELYRRLDQICETKTQQQNLRAELIRRGAIEIGAKVLRK